jgi:hypothetical protein
VICKGCGEDKALIDAHIIPKAFFMNLRKDSNHLNVIGGNNYGRVKRSFKGEYDQNILCKKCDSVFESYDDYAIKLLINKENEVREVRKNGECVGWEVDFNYSKFYKFLLSVLWRASISKRPFFELINLGVHENIIKNEIFSADVNLNSRYNFLLSVFSSDSILDLEKTILGPYSIKINGVNYCKVYLLGYVAWLKVDSRPTPKELIKFIAKDGECLKIIENSFISSKERASIVSIHSIK